MLNSNSAICKSHAVVPAQSKVLKPPFPPVSGFYFTIKPEKTFFESDVRLHGRVNLSTLKGALVFSVESCESIYSVLLIIEYPF
jgi:hypothetical protein